MKPRIGITLELNEKGGKETSFLDLAYAECVKGAGGIPMHFPPLPSDDFIEGIKPFGHPKGGRRPAAPRAEPSKRSHPLSFNALVEAASVR